MPSRMIEKCLVRLYVSLAETIVFFDKHFFNILYDNSSAQIDYFSRVGWEAPMEEVMSFQLIPFWKIGVQEQLFDK